jgi:hypothetical protein
MKTGPHIKINKKPPETILTRHFLCRHVCKIFFSTAHWRDQHNRRFHAHTMAEQARGGRERSGAWAFRSGQRQTQDGADRRQGRDGGEMSIDASFLSRLKEMIQPALCATAEKTFSTAQLYNLPLAIEPGFPSIKLCTLQRLMQWTIQAEVEAARRINRSEATMM